MVGPTKTVLTVEDAIRALFPRGYLDDPRYRRRLNAEEVGGKPDMTFSEPPCKAVDLFAIAGFLLLRSGAYHHVSPEVASARSSRMLTVTKTDRDRWVRVGRKWRGDGEVDLPAPPKELKDAWAELMKHRHRAVYRAAEQMQRPRMWWQAALALFCIADEAAKNVGFEVGPKSAQSRIVEYPLRDQIKRGIKVSTLSAASQDQVCVLPKSRTAKVGCTLRSLSHNLALLPARGLARAYWSPAAENAAPTAMSKPFNMVLVPAPYRIQAHAFHGIPAQEGTWGWFEVEPHWCPLSGPSFDDRGFDLFASFIESLLDKAAADVGEVHGLVFPEVALSYDVFERLCERLKARRHFELLIGGIFDARFDDGPRLGNFAAMASFQTKINGARDYALSVREKHHRWRIDGAQIESYALGSALDANFGWWERIDLLSRSLDMFVVRGSATVTTLICEDLARNDPCQELVRGVGPNLVVALLMDGPQLGDRWPARYATVLAEDPGSSVLTFTSFGLIHRSNQTERYPPSRKIGLWRDDRGRTTELVLPGAAHGLCLSIQPSRLTERTLDGRSDKGDAQSWRLTGVTPVAADAPNGDILEGRWPVGV